ncbi:MAG: dihydroneopterin aldolase [Candidatus Poribacteria bacterium]|nr:dihydroneopterin aldolase [Candidatus Poribacteria bacterium]
MNVLLEIGKPSASSGKMDRLIIKGVRFHGYHGVSESERQVGQEYEIDADLTCDLSLAGAADELAHTIDYGEVVSVIVEIGTRQSFQLIEALAETVASVILDEFPVEEVRITVKKLSPPIEHRLNYAGVRIRRKRNSHA